VKTDRLASFLLLLAAGSLACSPLSALVPGLFATPTATAAPSATPSATASATATPYPTRTASPTLISGIEEPVAVGAADVRITKALLRDTFRCGEERIPIANPEKKQYLVVLMSVLKGPVLSADRLSEWIRKNELHLLEVDSSAGRSIPMDGLCYRLSAETRALEELEIAFVVDRQAEWFVLTLPDQTEIPLDSLIP
jgi:hypothetical protein